MNRTRTFVIAAVLTTAFAGLAIAGPAPADAATPRVDRREVRQHLRIHQGVVNGSLTRREAVRLRAGQRHVHRMEFRAKRDGVVTRGECRRLNRAQNRQSRAIWRLKHNARVR